VIHMIDAGVRAYSEINILRGLSERLLYTYEKAKPQRLAPQAWPVVSNYTVVGADSPLAKTFQ